MNYWMERGEPRAHISLSPNTQSMSRLGVLLTTKMNHENIRILAGATIATFTFVLSLSVHYEINCSGTAR